jgi:hypothetical protein
MDFDPTKPPVSLQDVLSNSPSAEDVNGLNLLVIKDSTLKQIPLTSIQGAYASDTDPRLSDARTPLDHNQPATTISVEASGFNKFLSPADTNLQLIVDKLDAIVYPDVDNFVSNDRTVNNKPLSADVNLTFSDVGAEEAGTAATLVAEAVSAITYESIGAEQAGVASTLVAEAVSGLAPAYHNHQIGIDGEVFVTEYGNGTLSLSTVKAWFPTDATEDYYAVHIIGGEIMTPVDDTTCYIIADQNTNAWVLTTDPSMIDYHRYIPYMIVFKRALSTNLHTQVINFKAHGELESWHKRDFMCGRYKLEKGALQGLTCADDTLAITCGGGGVWTVGHRYQILPITTDTRQFDLENTGAYWIMNPPSHLAPYANNSQYQGETSFLPLDDGYWNINYIYRGIEDQDHTYLVLSTEQFASKELAQASKTIGSLPDLITSHTEFVGRIITQKGMTSGFIVESAFDTIFQASSSITKHSALIGLNDDDHKQYLLRTDFVTPSVSSVTGLQDALDSKQASGNYQPAGDYANTIHNHEISAVNNLQTTLDSKQPSGSYAPTIHNHSISAVTGLQAALDSVSATGAYAPLVHNHAISGVTGLQPALDSKASTAHALTHINTGTDAVPMNNWHGVVSRTTVSPLPTTISTTLFSLNCTATPLQYYYKGTLVTINTVKTANVITGKNFIYFADASGNLSVGNAFPDQKETVLLATVIWNGVDLGLVNDERHNHTRNIDWHVATHEGIGTRYISGIGFSFAGTTNANTTFATTSGLIDDEDIKFIINAQTTARIWYQTSANNYAFVNALSPRPYWGGATGGSGIFAVNATTFAQLTITSSNRYFNYFVYASTDVLNPIYVIAESTTTVGGYTSVANARAVSPPVIGVTNLSTELKLLYRVVVDGAGLVQPAIVADDYRTGGSIAGGGTAATSHNSLANLEYAASGVAYGHINDQPQTISGQKTFPDGVIANISGSASGNMVNPMVTGGDLIYGGASGVPTRLVKGSDGQVLTLASGSPTWSTPVTSAPSFVNPMASAGDIIIGSTAGSAVRLPKATDGQVLTLVGGAPAWSNVSVSGGSGLTNPMTSAGDMIIGSTAGSAVKLAKSTDGRNLRLVAGLPAWAANYNAVSAGTGALTLDFSTGLTQLVNMTGNPAITLSGAVSGQAHVIILSHGASARVPTFSTTVKWKNTTLSVVANKYDIVTIVFDGTNYYGDILPGFA